MSMKKCSKCKQDKPLTEFYKDRRRKDGLQCWCKACLLLYRRTPEGLANHRRANHHYRLSHPEKKKAQLALQYAIRAGKIERPVICPSCDTETFIFAHHEDYSKPLEVLWLCQECHTDADRQQAILRFKKLTGYSIKG